jgi:tuftelin-interacting protein 11
MDAFLQQHVVPKLHQMMSTFRVNPAHQEITEFNALMQWQSLLPTNTFVNILSKHFFPKWHQALYVWLSSVSANFDEISGWYTGWKNQFPKQLHEVAAIKRTFLKKFQ